MIHLTDNAVRRIGYLVAVASMTLAGSALVIYLAIGHTAKLFEDWALHNIVTTAIFGIVGLLALRTQPRNRAVWATIFVLVFGSLQAIGAAIGLAIAGFSIADIQTLRASAAPADIDPFAALAFQTALWTWVPAQFTLLTVFMLRVPNGDLRAPAWRWVERAAILTMAAATSPAIMQMGPWSDVPYDVFFADGVMSPAFGVLGLLAIVCLAGLILRYRSSVGEERLRLRWIMWALGIAVVGSTALLIDLVLSQFVDLFLIVNAGVSLGVAITKYRLYEIDRIISRTVTYTLVAAAVAAIYILPVLTLPRLLGQSNDLITAASTLAAAAAFNPLRRRTQRAVDRRFNRARYHTEQELDAYATRLADQVDLDTVTTDLQAVVARTLTPTTTSTWIRHHQT